MKTMSNKTIFRWGAYAGCLSAIDTAAMFAIGRFEFELLIEVLYFVFALAYVVYVYGLFTLGVFYKSTLLRCGAVLLLITSILTDIANAAFVYFPVQVTTGGVETFLDATIGFTLICGLIATFFGIFKIRRRLGTIALWYLGLCLTVVVLLLVGSSGSVLITVNALVFIPGSYLLWRESQAS